MIKQIQNKVLQKEGQDNKLYRVVHDYVPKSVLTNKNRNKSWLYGYNDKYDLVIISKTGELGEVVDISGLKIGLPKAPKVCHQRHKDYKEQYWERLELPKPLSKIQSIFQWNNMPSEFKSQWVDYIEKEFDNREDGYWFMNNGKPT